MFGHEVKKSILFGRDGNAWMHEHAHFLCEQGRGTSSLIIIILSAYRLSSPYSADERMVGMILAVKTKHLNLWQTCIQSITKAMKAQKCITLGVIAILAHETHQTDVMPSELSSTSCIRGVANTPTELELAS